MSPSLCPLHWIDGVMQPQAVGSPTVPKIMIAAQAQTCLSSVPLQGVNGYGVPVGVGEQDVAHQVFVAVR